MSKKLFLNIIKVCFSLSLLYYIFHDINFLRLQEVLYNVRLDILLLAFSLFYVSLFLSGFKLAYILGNTSHTIQITKLNFITVFLNNFIPGSITSDIYKGYKLKEIFPIGKITFGIISDRISGLIVLMLFFLGSGIFFIDFISNYFSFSLYQVILGISILSLIILCGFCFRKYFLHSSIVKDFFSCIYELQFKKIYKILLITFCIRILIPTMFFLELTAISSDFSYIPFYYIIFITTTTELLNILPITIKGYGIREVVWIGLLSPFGINIEVIAALSLLIVLNDIMASMLGCYFFSKSKYES